MIIQILFLFLTTALFLHLLLRKPKRLPPGPPAWPIIGNCVELFLADANYPHLAMSKLAEKYGQIVSFRFGMYHSVLLSSLEVMKAVAKYPGGNNYRHQFPYITERNFKKSLGLIWGEGQTWIDVRKITKKSLREFGYGKLARMEHAMAEISQELVDSVKKETKNGIYCVGSTELFAASVVNILWSLVGGYKFNLHDEKIRRNFEINDKMMTIFGHNNPYNVFPFLKTWFPSLMKHAEHLKIHKEAHEFFKELIEDARSKRNDRLDTTPTSFIEFFLDKIDENEGKEHEIYTYEHLQVILMDLFIAGSETTGTLLKWTLLYLVWHPDIQTKLRNEINKITENGKRKLVVADLPAMTYTHATILEALRVGNIVPLPPPREAGEDMEVGEYVIPKGTTLFFNMRPVFQDKSFWGDPEVFRPERFITSSGTIDPIKCEKAMIAFGVGTRVCFGDTLGFESMFLFLTNLVENFQFDAIPGKMPSAEKPDSGMTIRPRPYEVKLTCLK